MCCMSTVFSCVFPADRHFELIKATLHVCFQSCLVPLFFFFFLSRVLHNIFQVIIVIKGFMANGIKCCAFWNNYPRGQAKGVLLLKKLRDVWLNLPRLQKQFVACCTSVSVPCNSQFAHTWCPATNLVQAVEQMLDTCSGH